MILEIFSKRLCEFRRERNLTLKNVGNAINCNRQAISNVERGKKPASLDMVIALADFYEVSIDYLLGKSLSTLSCTNSCSGDKLFGVMNNLVFCFFHRN